MTQSKYVFADNPEERERERLRQFEGWGDRYTTRRLESIGIPAGWRCLDVGAGSGSVATLLAHRVGPSGTVVAADIDLRFLANLPPNVEVRRHDITTSDMESKSYDFVHFRALLMHLPDPRAALARIMAALKPGGWLLAEEADWGFCTVGGHPDAAWATDYLHDLFARHERAGIRHPYLGRTLPALVAEFDLESLEGDVAAPIVGEGGSGLDIIRLTVRALRSPSTTLGASEEDLDRLDSVLASPRVVVVGVASIAVRGRKSA